MEGRLGLGDRWVWSFKKAKREKRYSLVDDEMRFKEIKGSRKINLSSLKDSREGTSIDRR